MNIGAAAKLASLPAKTIRYYEEINLVQPARAENGYREYCEQDIHCLRFIQRARSLGFSIEECRSLLSLYKDEQRASADVKTLAQAKIAEVERKIKELQTLKSTLKALVSGCHGDQRPECPIMDDLASGRQVL